MAYRVVRYWANEEDRTFAICEPTNRLNPTTHPLLHYGGVPGFCLSPRGQSVEELRKDLHAMLAALDEPHLDLIPERLVPAKLV